MASIAQLKELEKRAWRVRLELVKMFSFGKVHRFGGSLSCAEIVNALFFYKMNYCAFGWETFQVDGHDMKQICDVLDRFDGANAKPFAVIADTVKGRGVSSMENTYKYHNASLSQQDYCQAIDELQRTIANLSG